MKRKELIEEFVQKLICTNHMHRRIIERRVSKTGVPRSQHRLLMNLYFHSESSQRDLAEAFEVSTATIAGLVKKLEKNGYVAREMDQKDNRYNKVTLTDKGEEIVKSSKQIFEKADKELLQGFSTQEIQQLNTYWDRLIENINKMEESK